MPHLIFVNPWVWLTLQGAGVLALLALLAVYAIYRRRYISSIVSGETAHFEPMVQTSQEALAMIFEDHQRDLFDDPSFYEEHERQRLIEAVDGRE